MDKFEIRISKLETNPNFQMTKIQTVLNIRNYDFEFVSTNFIKSGVFRASDFLLSEQAHPDKKAVFPEAGNYR
jgi:hypothetical protein